MKSLNKIFAVSTLLALSFACAPVSESTAIDAPVNNEPTVTTQEAAFSWTDDAANCCGGKPIMTKPKI